jgi:hypothetical protein
LPDDVLRLLPMLFSGSALSSASAFAAFITMRGV